MNRDGIFARNAELVRDVQAEYEEVQEFYSEHGKQQKKDVILPQDISTPINVIRQDQQQKRSSSSHVTNNKDDAAIKSTLQDEDGEESDDNNSNDKDSQDGVVPNNLMIPFSGSGEKKKKKKKKKKSKTANLPEAGTDLPDDYQEKYTEDIVENPYDPSQPVARRVEHALWKYRKNHKFSEENRTIFDSYLRFGGVNTSPNAFLGRATSADTPADPDAEIDYEAAQAAIDAIDLDDDDDDNNGYVSFSEVVQVYLGNYFCVSGLCLTMQGFISAPILIDAFLRYLQIRSVCPEYTDDLIKAREWTALAKDQLPRCKRISNDLPGKFNTACRLLFDPKSKDSESNELSGVPAWAMGDPTLTAVVQSYVDFTVGMTRGEARLIIGSIIPNADSEHVIDRRDCICVKITQIGDDDRTVNDKKDEDALVMVNLAEYDEDADQVIQEKSYTLYFENSIADQMLVGMVLKVTLQQLSGGQWFLDHSIHVCPAFYKKDEFAEDDE
ncbi:Argonaute siRNA chaperone complex subunit Arb1-domain-containing protein [Halteromyces radiatus]|uniref:Argonaute siRNA chaperone complex subunit Arb1-domain-containing protein n=1 Tax=Halteromyces radiatus TaxID=101107 RepID=UPI00221E9CF5|nr:Argonaute siRNA chaperone complex subunit Arb1-domain-containing protein [Halteromyces radiatus]KAI8096365.1 Argonaute siRNA chaperone complex subunit Arb1-domain-containing protein [Halteromyces radiatus]